MDRREFLKTFGAIAAVAPEMSRIGSSPEHDDSRQSSSSVNFSPLPHYDIVLIACGGEGIEMTKGIDKVAYGISRIVALDTDKRTWSRTGHHCDAFYWIRQADGTEVTTADEAWNAAEDRTDDIRQLIGRPHIAIIVTGLGSVAAFGLPYRAAICARQAGALTLAFATFPLAYERPDTESLASAGVSMLQRGVHNLVTYDHRIADRCIPTPCRKSSIYHYATFGLRQYLWNTAGCLRRYGTLAIDIADVEQVLSQLSDDVDSATTPAPITSKLGWGSAEGTDRAHRAVLMALQHPLLELDQLGPLYGISVSIRAASRTLNMQEIHTVMNRVRDCGDPDTWVIFSADGDDTLREEIQVSLIAVPTIAASNLPHRKSA